MNLLVYALNGVFTILIGATLSACAPSNPTNTSEDGSTASSNQLAESATGKDSSLLQWHKFTDRLTGITSKYVEKNVVLQRGGQARLEAGCDERGRRTIRISFSADDQTPLGVERLESTRFIISDGSAQYASPALDGPGSVIFHMYSPNGKSHPDSYGEVLDAGIPQRVEMYLSDGETPIISFDNQNTVLRGAFKACPRDQ